MVEPEHSHEALAARCGIHRPGAAHSAVDHFAGHIGDHMAAVHCVDRLARRRPRGLDPDPGRIDPAMVRGRGAHSAADSRSRRAACRHPEGRTWALGANPAAALAAGPAVAAQEPGPAAPKAAVPGSAGIAVGIDLVAVASGRDAAGRFAAGMNQVAGLERPN